MNFGLNDITGALSGLPNIRVWGSNGRLKMIGGVTPPPAPVVWGSITGTVTNQTDLINYLGLNFYPLSSNPAGYITQAAADLLYYPLSSNPAGYITSAALAGYVPNTRTLTINGTTYDLSADRSWTIPAGGTVTSVGLTVPSAFSVTPSSITTSGTFVITGAGTISQYIDGTGALQAFPTIPAQYNPTAGTGISITGSYPNQTITNTLPDQTVVLTGGTGISTSGTYPNFTITNTSPDQTVSLSTTGTGLSVTGTYPSFTLENTLPDQIVAITGGTGIGVTGTYPSFTITATGGGGGGAAGKTYYLNGGTNQGVFAGNTYYEMSPIPVVGTNADFTISSNGYIAQFITDAGNPNQTVIPAGNWNFELWFSSSSSGGSPEFYVELYKYDTIGLSFTLIASSAVSPEGITNGTTIDLYFSAISVPQTTLLTTDRLAVRVWVNNSGRTITLHTQDSHLSEIFTTFPSGIVSLNGLTASIQTFTAGTAGTDFAIVSSDFNHTFNLPLASAANTGKLSSTDWSTFNNKVTSLSAGTGISIGGTTTVPIVTNTAPDQTVILSAGTGINVSGTYPSFTVTNSAPDQVVALTPGTGIGITGTYPNFTITNSSPSSGGTVTSVSGAGTAFGLTLTGTVTTSGSLTLGGTLAVPIANITATGTPSATTFLRGDGSWATPAGGGGGTATIGATIDGSGGTITIGQRGYVQIPYACTINSWRIIANTSGSIVIDITKAAAPTIPTLSITGSALPTLSSQQTNASSTLTGWTTSVAANDIIGFNVNSASIVSWVIIQLFVTKL